MATSPNRTVRGRVLNADGSPVQGASVQAYSKRLRRAEDAPLGDPAQTDKDGRYVVEYNPTKRDRDLYVQVRLSEKVVATSAGLLGAGPDETLDVVLGGVYRGPSQYERIKHVLKPVLDADELKAEDLADFDEHDLAFLSVRSGVDPRELVLLRQSIRLANDEKLSVELFYGLGRQNMPLNLPELLAQDPAKRRAAAEAALAEGEIPDGMAETVMNELGKLEKRASKSGETTLGGLLKVAGLNADQREKLVKAYAEHQGPTDAFWKGIRATDGFSQDEIDRVQFTLQLGVVTQNHLPLVKALDKHQKVNELKDLAGFEPEDWLDLIRTDDVGLPAHLDAAQLTKEDYADMVFCGVEQAFPRAMLAARIHEFDNPRPLERFFTANPGFEMHSTPVAAYLRQHPDALDGSVDEDNDKASVAKRLKGLERTYRIAPDGARVKTMKVLMNDGVDSAQKVRALGKSTMERRYKKELGKDGVETVWAKASNASALATILLARHHAMFDRSPPEALPTRATTLKGLPDYEALFGSLDFCACQHCQSVYSPAAYLVDMLHWLHNRPSKEDEKTALNILFGTRRADIGTIELSCKNTNTPLPYIDLINEVLELLIAPPGGDWPSYQTTGTDADLLAHPEHLHVPAYDVLAGAGVDRDAVFPFSLPYNLWLDETRTYLGQLGVTRVALMDALRGKGSPSAWADVGVAMEVLEASPLEWDVIAGKMLNPPRSPKDFWGMEGEDDWVAKLKNVSTWLNKTTPPLADSPMGFDELTDLLRAGFVQAPGALGVWFEDSTCDTTKATLVGLTAAHLARLHQFVRLQRRLGWSVADLDRAIDVLGAGELDEAFLTKVSHALRLVADLDIPLDELLAWWGPLDTRRWRPRLRRGSPAGAPAGDNKKGFGFVCCTALTPHPDKTEDQSQYDRLFQNPTTTASGTDTNAVFGVAPGGAALADEMQNIADNVPSLTGALGVTAGDLAALLPRLPDDKLTLANLSALFRHVSLASALGLTARQLASVIDLTGINPFDAGDTEQTLSLLQEVRAIRESGFSIEELDYLLRHADTQPTTQEPQPAEIGLLLLELRDALRKVETDHPLPAEAASANELSSRLAAKLAETLSSADVTTVMAVVDVPVGKRAPENTGKVIDDHLARLVDPNDAKKKLVDDDPPDPDRRRTRLLDVLCMLIERIRCSAKESAVIEKLSTALRLDPAVLAPMVRNHLKHPDTTGDPVLKLLISNEVRDFPRNSNKSAAPTATDLPAQFAAYLRLHKASMLLKRLRVTSDELTWVMSQGPVHGTLDMHKLPIAPAPDGVLYRPWRRLRNAALMRNEFVPHKLFDALEAAAAAGTDRTPAAVDAALEVLLSTIEQRSGWIREDIEFLVGTPARDEIPATAGALGFAFPADWKDEQPLTRIAEVLAVVRRVGLPAKTIWDWRRIPLARDYTPADKTRALAAQRRQADDVKQAVRARYSDAEWHEVARSLRDRVRERQRQGLVEWLVAHDSRFKDTNALSQHVLLDVQMSPCQLSSRIKQAISSVQLYVQRALMSREPHVDLSSGDAREWKWMKNYRIWEANRKVFLYPENWIEPELRDDKTPFFEELENDLLQNELTADAAEHAVQAYLDKLDNVARLEVAGFFHQKPTKGDSADILHVFGRTRGTPAQYFYRQRLDGWRWSPWNKMEVDIEGDHLLPVVHNRRLYIFWAQITETALDEVPGTPEKGGDRTQEKPEKYFQLRLAWAEHRSGQWSSKKTSTAQIGATPEDYGRLSRGLRKTNKDRKSDFFFHADNDQDGDLLIEPIRYVRATSANPRGYYVRLDRFRLSGCDGMLSLEQSNADHLKVSVPNNTQTVNQNFAATSSGVQLTLSATNPDTGSLESATTLSKTPSRFEVVPHRVLDFKSAEVFFYQDLRRTFFVEPRDLYRWVRQPRRVLQPIPEVPARRPPPIPEVPPPQQPPGCFAPEEPNIPDEWRASPHSAHKIAVEFTTNTAADSPGEAPRFADGKDLRELAAEMADRPPTLKTGIYNPGTLLQRWDGKRFLFSSFYHPYLCIMMRQFNRFGLDGLLDASPTGPEPDLKRQRLTHDSFEEVYAPLAVDKPYPKDKFDFSPTGSYAPYNWEVFFHIPFLVASHLSSNQRFEEALRWFHYIFDPTEPSGGAQPQRFWKVRPFFELFYGEDANAGPIHELLLLLQYDGSDPEMLDARDALIDQVAEWRKKPFNPHAIARIRPTAYQKAVVMKYIDNLIQWGDQLFRRNTMESINEATQLYMLAAQILGPRPKEVAVDPPAPRTFNMLLDEGLDELSNALVEEVEGFLPEIASRAGDIYEDDLPVVGPTLFFCVPPNAKLITDYWDRVADRLFKLRHCMNIEGIVGQIPLFEPPIDPSLLMRAAAAGKDLAGALSDLHAPLPLRRFRVLAQKAAELCADVRGLGQALLSALEKKDAEELARLRSGHEIKLQTAMVEVRKKQIDDANEALESLKRSKENAEIRLKYYRSRLFMNPNELLHVAMLESARTWNSRAQIADLTGSIVGASPNVDIGISGFGGSPVVKTSWGSAQMIQIAKAVADGFRMKASAASHNAQMANIMAGYERRRDNWTLQGDVAQKEIAGLERQILGAEVRVAIAEKELDNLKQQIEQSKENEEFLRDKYTDAQLYQWMADQISSLYFQSYKLAYDLAKRAERAWQFELAQFDRSFIQFGNWDGLKKGLLAGEGLHHDIKRMEVAYLDDRRREYELTRHVSLRKLDPIALLRLRRDGECVVRVPEAWFDLDSPGHYMRRIKTVALSIPAVAGPHVPVRCTLTLLRSSIRVSPKIDSEYARTGVDDPRFRDDIVGMQSIVTSRAKEDSGLFETNLHDELYLPFEGAGADSEWRLELPRSFRQFDYDTIADVVLHLRYTAREGGSELRKASQEGLRAALGSQTTAETGSGGGLFCVVSARRDFPDAWARFLTPPDSQTDQAITFDIGSTLFPFAFQDATIKVAGFELIMLTHDTGTYAAEPAVKMSVAAPDGGVSEPVDLRGVATEMGGLPHGDHDYGSATKGHGDWVVIFEEADNENAAPSVVVNVNGHKRLNAAAVEDLLLVLRYLVAP